MCDLTFGISLSLAVLEHVESLDLFGIAIEVLAFDFDVGHAIASLALPLAAGGLLLAGAHTEDCAEE